MRHILVLFLFIVLFHTAQAGGNKIKAYFNTPVDASFSTGAVANYSNKGLDDTLVAYISRTKYSLDIAVFDYESSSSIANIASAINAAYTRGVRVRIIHDGSLSNTGWSTVNGGIHIVTSPSGGNYNIMHNKFVVFDQRSPTATDHIIWTGSTNWTSTMFNYDVNNVIIIQDSALAHAYYTEFNEMWGDTSLTPKPSNAKFGPDKTDNTQHIFTIDGHQVECYFSPSDGTNSHILSAINTADKELYFGVYTFTYSADATAINSKIAAGVTVKGIMDHYSVSYTPYATLSPIMGANLKVYNIGGDIYHSKMMVVDPQYPTMDPLVLTGSHNWSVTADQKNDENTLIIHDSTIANMYLQSFVQNFKDLGGIFNHTTATAIQEIENGGARVSVYPNPTNDIIRFRVADSDKLFTATLSTIEGQQIGYGEVSGNEGKIDLTNLPVGLYLLEVETMNGVARQRVVKY